MRVPGPGHAGRDGGLSLPRRPGLDGAIVPGLLLLVARDLLLHDPPRTLAWRLAHDETPLPVAPIGTIECTCGYLVNMVDRTIRLITPCTVSERWPLGYWDLSKPAAEASEEAGERILEVVTDYLARFTRAFCTLPLRREF